MATAAAAAAAARMAVVSSSSSPSSVALRPALRGARELRARVAAAVPAGAGSQRRLLVTMKASGKFFVGGNWKCNGTRSSVDKLVSELNAGNFPSDVEVIVAPPFIYLDAVARDITPNIQVSAQNCWIRAGGAYTGEISAEMLVDASIPWVILGHSERRALCGESNEVVGQKAHYALEKGLKVIACIGETGDQRKSNQTLSVVTKQLEALAAEIEDWTNVVVAYEPVWAIGTGLTASPSDAQEVHSVIRKWLNDNVSPSVASATRIIYGGSVSPATCEDLAKEHDIDGFLVGGASLQGPSFVKICNAQEAALKAAA
eukprot:jgi/Chlat1/2367/Chrsp17S02641